jgi:hypothetical protein
MAWAGRQRFRGLGASERFRGLLTRFDSTERLEGLCLVGCTFLQLSGFGSVIFGTVVVAWMK